MYKILLGIPASISYLTQAIKEAVDDRGLIKNLIVHNEIGEDYWCDFSVEYDMEEKYYYLSFETCIGFEEDDGCRKWIVTCFEEFTNYMYENGYDTSRELNMYQVFTEGINARSHFKTIEDAYAFMKFVVNGFHGNGMVCKRKE